jgi:hypothetical protein
MWQITEVQERRDQREVQDASPLFLDPHILSPDVRARSPRTHWTMKTARTGMLHEMPYYLGRDGE